MKGDENLVYKDEPKKSEVARIEYVPPS